MTINAFAKPNLLNLPDYGEMKRIAGREPLYQDVQDFLIDEAELLNAGKLAEWLALLAPDITYFMPVRATKMNGAGPEFSEESGHFEEDHASLSFRVKKLSTPSSWGENPSSRTRRMISQLRLFSSQIADEYYAITSFLIARSRLSSPHIDLLSGERHDVIRKASSGFQIVSRCILSDETTLGTPNLAIFL